MPCLYCLDKQELEQNLEPSPTMLLAIRGQCVDRRAWESACATLVTAWEPVVRVMARRHAPQPSLRPDFAQVARLALLRAALRFDRGQRRPFAHYARRSLRNALLDEAERQRRSAMISSGANNTIVVGDSALAALVRREVRGVVRQRLRSWVQRWQSLVELLFVEELSQAEVARRLRLSPARICQLFQEIRRYGQQAFADLADAV